MTVVERTWSASFPTAVHYGGHDHPRVGGSDARPWPAPDEGGVEFGTALPRGTVLRAGDCFVLDDERRVVMVVERPEAVFVIEPRSAPEWALFAYHIGNRHQPLMVTDQALVCPDVPGVELLLQQHKMPYARATMPFTPAATVAAHQH